MTFNVIDSYGYGTSQTTFARIVDATSTDVAYYVHVDSSGNSYLCGVYAGTTPQIIATSNSNVNTVVATLPTPSGSDGFCSKFDTDGNYQYSILIRGTTSSEVSYSACTDSNNNLYVIGTPIGQSNIAIVSNSNVMTTLSNIFVNTTNYVACASKFSSTGTYLYSLVVYTAGGADVFGLGGTCDLDGNIYLCGFINSPSANISYYSNTNVQTVVGTFSASASGFASKFNSSGAYQGTCRVTGSTNQVRLQCATSDSDKNVYFGGYIEGTNTTIATISSSNVTTTVGFFSGLNPSAILCKFSPTLTYQYSIVFTENGNVTPTTQVTALDCDSLQNVYAGGIYAGTGNTTSIRYISPSNVLTTMGLLTAGSNTLPDGFATKFNSAGTYQYSVTVNTSSQNEAIQGINCDSFDNVYFAGVARSVSANISFVSNANVISNVGTLPAYAGAFSSKINTSGTYQYSLGLYSQSGSDSIGYSVSTDYYGNMYLAGQSQIGPTANIYSINSSNVISNVGKFTNLNSFGAFVIKANANGNY